MSDGEKLIPRLHAERAHRHLCCSRNILFPTFATDGDFPTQIINSLASHRPASEASLLALGIRPSTATSTSSPSPSLLAGGSNAGSADGSPAILSGAGAGGSPVHDAEQVAALNLNLDDVVGGGGNADQEGDIEMMQDLEPLPPTAEPPGSTLVNGASAMSLGASSSKRRTIGGGSGGARTSRTDGLGANSARDESIRAHKAVFFFKLGRELEKINAFYLTKERDLRLRLLTLLNNRERLLYAVGRPSSAELGAGGVGADAGVAMSVGETSRRGMEWANLEEGWRLFERDLGKLQQFIEINATGFRKILKKWDKRSKTSTKELYLERQVEVQPCFNRETIAKMADIVAANILDLENGASNVNTSFLNDLPEALGGDGLHFARSRDSSSPALASGVQAPASDAATGFGLAIDTLSDLEHDLEQAIAERDEAEYTEWLKVAKERQNAHPSNTRLMRLVWRAIEQFPPEYLEMELGTLRLDFGFVDHINVRTPLHEACIQGRLDLVKLCIAHNVDTEARDAYDRRPIHYAAMHGHPAICAHLLQTGVDSTATDMDGYTPLVQAVISGQLECVEMLVKHADQATIEPSAISSDLIPLSLACQYGHFDVAQLLLRHGAKVLPNSEGLYPQHLAARSGHSDICQLLISEGGASGGGKDRADKYNAWTPLHYACVGGTNRHFECAKVLVCAGVDVNAVDEYGKSAGFYAGWYGQIECLSYLIASGAKLELVKSQKKMAKMPDLGLGGIDSQGHSLSPSSDNEDELALDGDADLIPSLSLPPPIIPLRMYGHDFLAKRSLVQLTLGHPSSTSASGPSKSVPPVKLYNRSDDGNLLNHWSSLKLVMTSKPDATAIPHSVILPLADEREIFSFQVEDLDKFVLELSLYPTFGSKVIGRAIVLPSTFNAIRQSRSMVVPLLDHHLKAIGEVAFHVQCIRPFEGAQLEIGGRVETYWKATTAANQAGAVQDHAHQFQPHRPLSVAATSPSMASANAGSKTSKAPKEAGFVTASSLAGDYLHLAVQVTKDYVPVVYSDWSLPYDGLDIGVSDVTLKQFQRLAATKRRTLTDLVGGQSHLDASGWHEVLGQALVELSTVLATLPVHIGINLELRHTSDSDAAREGLMGGLDLNRVIDSVLATVYDAARTSTSTAADGQRKSRKIIFSGSDAALCTHIQLKQPNFAVFYTSFCNVSPRSGDALEQATPDEQSLSVRDAVKLAKSQNMLGVILDGRLLRALPYLVQSVKDAGLLLITMGSSKHIADLRRALGDQAQLDGYVVDG